MKKLLLVVAVAGAAGAGVYKWQSKSAPAADASVVDRFWIDHIPQNERDKFHVFAVVKKHGIGIFEIRSRWTGTFEAFRYEKHNDEIRALFPQTGDKETLKVTATKCNERGMDFCLDISGNSRGVKRYYSKKDWVIRTHEDADALAEKLGQ